MLGYTVVSRSPRTLTLLGRCISRAPSLGLVNTCRGTVRTMSKVRRDRLSVLFLTVRVRRVDKLRFTGLIPVGIGVVFAATFGRCTVRTCGIGTFSCLIGPVLCRSFVRAYRGMFSRCVRSSACGPVGHSNFMIIEGRDGCAQVPFRGVLFVRDIGSCIGFRVTSKHGVVALNGLGHLRRGLPHRGFEEIRHSFVTGLAGFSCVRGVGIICNGLTIPVSSAGGSSIIGFMRRRKVGWRVYDKSMAGVLTSYTVEGSESQGPRDALVRNVPLFLTIVASASLSPV